MKPMPTVLETDSFASAFGVSGLQALSVQAT
jgi:hypothetical protein